MTQFPSNITILVSYNVHWRRLVKNIEWANQNMGESGKKW